MELKIFLSFSLTFATTNASNRDTHITADHLIGNDPNMKKGFKFEALRFQTNCHIDVHGPEFGMKRGSSGRAEQLHTMSKMQVIIKPTSRTNSQPSKAKQMIEESLRAFVGGDGSKGRFAYDLAAAEENTRCRASRFNAVYQWNPFIDSSRKMCMNLIELPFKKISHRNGTTVKDFHGGFLLKTNLMRDICNMTKCRVILCGDDFKRPTHLCDPYIFISGDW